MTYDYDWCGHTPEPTDEQPTPRPCGAPIERWSREWKHRRHEQDADHQAVPQPPVGPLEEGMFLRADRYAAAIAAAAAADQRITVLTELLRQHEWYREQAESQLRMVQEDERFGQVWDQTGPEPEDVHALLCLTTGSIYVRNDWSQDWQLAHHNPSNATHHVWPIADAGPFIAWREGFDFDRVVKAARAIAVEHDELHRAWYGEPGYHDPDRRWGRPRLIDAFHRMWKAKAERTYEANQKAQAVGQQLRQLRRLIEYLQPDDTQQWGTPRDVAHGEELRDVEVIELAKVRELLDRPDCGGPVPPPLPPGNL